MAGSRRGGRRKHGELHSKKTCKRWVSAGVVYAAPVSRTRSSRLRGMTNHGENSTPRDQSSWRVSSANFPPVQKLSFAYLGSRKEE